MNEKHYQNPGADYKNGNLRQAGYGIVGGVALLLNKRRRYFFMQMTFRWYGEGNDSITPEMIKQIPGVTGLVWALHDKQAGEVWEVEEIEEARRQIEGAGFHMDVVELSLIHI